MNYNWNDCNHPRFKEVSNIVNLAMQCNDNEGSPVITAKIKAHGDNFTVTLLEYIEARYGSGHSMRYSMLRDVFKAMRVNKPQE